MRRLLLAALLAAACGPNNPTPVPVARTEPAKTEPTPAEPTKETKIASPARTDKAPEPPLTQAELDLIAADPAALTPEQRRARAHALRRKCLQNPEGACAKQLEEIRTAVESGQLMPQLPDRKSDMTLSAPSLPAPGAGEAAKADSGKTAAESGKTAPAPAGKTP